MAWDIFTLDNDIRTVGTVHADIGLNLGFSTVAGNAKTIYAVGTESNISIDFSPKGTSTLRVPSLYESLITSTRDIVNKGYTDIKIVGKNIDSLLQAPSSSENGFAITWNDSGQVWTLSPATGGGSYTFASGIQNDVGTVKLGNTPLTRNTAIFGNFNLALGQTGGVLSAFSVESTSVFINTPASSIRMNLPGHILSLQGGTPASSLVWGATGSITLTDGSTPNPRGLRGGGDYSANVLVNDYVQKVYVDNRLGGKLVSTLLQNPTPLENDYSVVWDNVLGRYTLKLITGGSGGGTSNSKEQQFVANGSQSVFTITNGTIALLSFVDVNGNVQQRGVSYTWGGQDINFGSNLPAGVIVTVHYFETLLIGGSGGGHQIYDNETPIPQREILSFRNGLTAIDDNGKSVVEIGGIFTKNTTWLGGGFNFIGLQWNVLQLSANAQASFTTNIGSGLIVQNFIPHNLVLGGNNGVKFDVGGDQVGDTYYRNASNSFVALPIGAPNTVLRSNGTTPEWSPNTGDTVINSEVFTANGSQSNFTVTNGTIDKINYVSVNGIIQTPAAFSVAGNTVSFGVNLEADWKVHISYFENVAVIEYNLFNIDGGNASTIVNSPEMVFDGGTA